MLNFFKIEKSGRLVIDEKDRLMNKKYGVISLCLLTMLMNGFPFKYSMFYKELSFNRINNDKACDIHCQQLLQECIQGVHTGSACQELSILIAQHQNFTDDARIAGVFLSKQSEESNK